MNYIFGIFWLAFIVGISYAVAKISEDFNDDENDVMKSCKSIKYKPTIVEKLIDTISTDSRIKLNVRKCKYCGGYVNISNISDMLYGHKQCRDKYRHDLSEVESALLYEKSADRIANNTTEFASTAKAMILNYISASIKFDQNFSSDKYTAALKPLRVVADVLPTNGILTDAESTYLNRALASSAKSYDGNSANMMTRYNWFNALVNNVEWPGQAGTDTHISLCVPTKCYCNYMAFDAIGTFLQNKSISSLLAAYNNEVMNTFGFINDKVKPLYGYVNMHVKKEVKNTYHIRTTEGGGSGYSYKGFRSYSYSSTSISQEVRSLEYDDFGINNCMVLVAEDNVYIGIYESGHMSVKVIPIKSILACSQEYNAIYVSYIERKRAHNIKITCNDNAMAVSTMAIYAAIQYASKKLTPICAA